MDISADKAYWLLGYHRDRSIRLHIGGNILGEEAAAEGKITAIDRDLRLLSVELYDLGTDKVWRRVIPLEDVAFSLYQLGKDSFEQWVAHRWHSVLVAKYGDGTTIFFAERMALP